MQAVGRHRNRLRKGHAKDRKQQCISISIEDSVFGRLCWHRQELYVPITDMAVDRCCYDFHKNYSH